MLQQYQLQVIFNGEADSRVSFFTEAIGDTWNLAGATFLRVPLE